MVGGLLSEHRTHVERSNLMGNEMVLSLTGRFSDFPERFLVIQEFIRGLSGCLLNPL